VIAQPFVMLEPEEEPEQEPEPEPEPEQRKVVCYCCGQCGHVRLDCPNPENPSAVAALKEFRTARKQRRNEQRRHSAKQPKQRESARIARDWLAGRGPDQCKSDPVALVVSHGTKQLQRDLAAAAKEHFDRGITHVAAELARGSASSAEEHGGAGGALATALRGALREGIPPDFGDAAALTAYTRERLEARCRYLYTLLLCEDEICTAARQQLLLPTPSTGASVANQRRPLSVLSIGGGPAFDHVALRLLASFLASVPPGDVGQSTTCPVEVCTAVLDLNETEWSAAAKAVAAAMGSATDLTLFGCTSAEQLHLGRCDVRLALNDTVNAEMASLAPTADIFVFSFVLHENAAGLLEQNGAYDWASDSSTLKKEPDQKAGDGDQLRRQPHQVRISDCVQSNLHTNLKSGPTPGAG
jgi:hypothetical protein